MNQLKKSEQRKENVSLKSLQETKMKDKTWIIVSIIMGLALIISIGYSLELRKKVNDKAEVIVSRSIVQITASNVSIKNFLTIKGTVEKKESQNPIDEENNELKNISQENISEENNIQENITDSNKNEEEKASYNIILNLNEESLNKIRIGQEAEIKIKNEEKTYKYKGEIAKIGQNETTNKKIAVVEFEFDENVKENMEAECTIVIEEAKNVIAIPLAAVRVRRNENNMQNTFNHQSQNNLTNEQNSENTTENISKEEKYVIVVNDDGTTSEVEVETGISDDSYVEIVSGLSEGQKVQIEGE